MRRRLIIFAGFQLTLIPLALFCLELPVLGNPLAQQKADEDTTYYYRDPQPNKLIPILESFLKLKDVTSNPSLSKVLVHFFATAFSKDSNKVEALKILQRSYSGEARQLIQRVMDKVRSYHPADLKSPADLDLLWTEYMATGNKEVIERLLKMIAVPTLSKPTDLENSARELLIHIAIYHHEVYDTLRKKADSSMGNERMVIAEIVGMIDELALNPASEHLIRGQNLYLQKKYNEAMEEFNKGLEYFPDYCSIYMSISVIHGDQNNLQEAIRTGKKAVSIEPENTGAISNLAGYYYRLKEYDQAIKWYERALQHDPKKIDCLYWLGNTYRTKGETKKAVIHFNKYLEYAPNGSHAAYVKRYLASLGQSFREDPSDVAAMLQNRRYDLLEKTLLSLLKGKTRQKDGTASLSQAYENLCKIQQPERSYAARISQFESWLAQYNSSHFANACLGTIYISYAWEARGAGYANTVTQEGGRLMEERLLKAKEYLDKAYSLDQSDPIVPARLIRVANALGLERREMEKRFQWAVLADPTDHEAYLEKLEYLKAKWHGSHEEMFSFAREAVRKAPPNSMIPMVLIDAHWEIYFQSNRDASYFRNPNVWKEMKGVYQTLSKSFPEGKTIQNWYARTAYLSGDYDVAREEIKKIGDDWQVGAWGNKKTFEEVKRELLRR